MFLSAINALTLVAGACAACCCEPHHGPRRGLIGYVMRGIDCVRDAYGAAVARMVRFSVIGIVVVAVAAAGIYGLAKVTPTGFLPEDDQGAFFVVVQLPGGASVARTSDVVAQAEKILQRGGDRRGFHLGHRPEFHRQLLAVERRLHRRDAQAVRGAQGSSARRSGASSRGSAPNSARSRAARSCRWRRRRSSASAPAAASPMCCRICAAAIRRRWRRCCAASSSPRTRIRSSTRVFSTFSATNPSIYLDIDRDKVQMLGVPLSDVFQALQASLGGYYVNDMNLFGRTWQVQVQAEAVGPQQHRRHLPHQCAQRRRQDDPVALASSRSASSSGRRPSSATTICAP